MTRYYAHTLENRPKEEWQTLRTHLEETASRARNNSLPLYRELAYFAGLLHDMGKYQADFQGRLEGRYRYPIEHAFCGAQYLARNFPGNIIAVALEYAIAGHHSGLPDYGAGTDNADRPTLCGKLKRESEDVSAFERELSDLFVKKKCEAAFERTWDGMIKTLKLIPGKESEARRFYEYYTFMVRYLFSVLTDADFIDTEEFCRQCKRTALKADFEEAQRRLQEKMDSFRADTPVKRSRAALQKQAMDKIDQDSGIYLLNMPTGSGKTLCSLSLALKRLRKGNKKRIIYVIPYTSIIEQTAQEFKKIVGEESGRGACLEILEHHCNFDFDALSVADRQSSIWKGLDKEGGEEGIRAENKLKAAAENWSAPVIVTTAVQFFESIYSNKKSRLRKLGNMADSILVFDEMHMLPVKYFQPCMSAIEQLTSYYNSEAIFLTATMPDFPALAEKYCAHKIPMLELIEDKRLFKDFYNSEIKWINTCSDERLLQRAGESKSSLIVVNRKKKARELYQKAPGRKYHLSTSMTPMDRQKCIKRIRADLEALRDGTLKEGVIVISTSLIEAGVDLDFSCVFRELAGVDNILQTAGRCNREGRGEGCIVYVFQFDERISGELGVKGEIARGEMERRGANALRNPECIADYFDAVYYDKRLGITEMNFSKDQKYFGEELQKFDFASYADRFRFIEEGSFSVVIPCEEIAQKLEQLRLGIPVPQRSLQPYAATVNLKEFEELFQLGAVKEYGGVCVLEASVYYDKETGISLQSKNGGAVFC